MQVAPSTKDPLIQAQEQQTTNAQVCSSRGEWIKAKRGSDFSLAHLSHKERDNWVNPYLHHFLTVVFTQPTHLQKKVFASFTSHPSHFNHQTSKMDDRERVRVKDRQQNNPSHIPVWHPWQTERRTPTRGWVECHANGQDKEDVSVGGAKLRLFLHEHQVNYAHVSTCCPRRVKQMRILPLSHALPNFIMQRKGFTHTEKGLVKCAEWKREGEIHIRTLSYWMSGERRANYLWWQRVWFILGRGLLSHI